MEYYLLLVLSLIDQYSVTQVSKYKNNLIIETVSHIFIEHRNTLLTNYSFFIIHIIYFINYLNLTYYCHVFM